MQYNQISSRLVIRTFGGSTCIERRLGNVRNFHNKADPICKLAKKKFPGRHDLWDEIEHREGDAHGIVAPTYLEQIGESITPYLRGDA